MDLSIRFRRSSSTAWLTIEGVVDARSHARLERRLLDIANLGCAVLHLDASGLTHIEPYCLHAIDDIRARTAVRGAEFHITAASMSFILLSLICGYPELAERACGGREAQRSRRWDPDAADRRYQIAG